MDGYLRKLLLDTLRIVPYTKQQDVAADDSAIAEAATVNENLHALGFTLRPIDIVLLAASPSKETLFQDLKELVPVMKAEPMYPDFPKQVMEISEAQFRFHQLFHYFSTYGIESLFGVSVSKGWLPEVERTPKTEEDVRLLPDTVLELVPEEEICAVAVRRILSRRERMTLPEQELVVRCFSQVPAKGLSFQIPFKENIGLLFEPVLMSFSRNDALDILSALCQHTGDVLTGIHGMLKTHRYALPTSRKRTLVRLLERYPVADFRGNLILSNRRREQNLTVLKYLDYNKYSTSPAHAEAVAALRDGLLRSWEGRAKKLLSEHSADALSFAAKRPGFLIRQLTWLISIGYSEEELTRALIPESRALSSRTLLRLNRIFSVDEEAELAKKEASELAGLAAEYKSKRDRCSESYLKYELDRTLYESEVSKNRSLQVLKQETDRKLAALEDSISQDAMQKELAALTEPVASQIAYATQSCSRQAVREEMSVLHLMDRILSLTKSLAGLEALQASGNVGESTLLRAKMESRILEDQLKTLRKKLSRCHERLEKVSKEQDSLRDFVNTLYYSEEEYWKSVDQVREKYAALRASAPQQRVLILTEEARQKEQILRSCEKERGRAHAKYRMMLPKASGMLEQLKAEEAENVQKIRVRYQEKRQCLAALPSRRRILLQLLAAHLAAIETPLRGKQVWLEEGVYDLKNSTLEGNQKSMDGTYVPSGFAFRIPEEAKRVRFYVYWNDPNRVDVDLHAGAETAGQTGNPHYFHVGWNSDFRKCGVVHSGDITHSDAAEYIDIDLEADVSRVSLNVDLYSGKRTLDQIEECFVGMMAVKDFRENVKLYSPANSFFTHEIRQKTRGLYYGYVDVRNRYVRFIGQPNTGSWGSLLPAEDPDALFSVDRYLKLLLEGQGASLAESREKAEVILTMEKTSAADALNLFDVNFFLDAV